MSLFKIAWRSIQYRGFGSFLTILSMALGVMLVVGVLTIHGVVSKSFKSNSSFGYNIIMGARGGALQLTLNTVFYLSKPIETIPYEYYLSFCDGETREREFANSITVNSRNCEDNALMLANQLAITGVPGPLSLISDMAIEEMGRQHIKFMESNEKGPFQPYVDIAIPVCLGDYYEVPGRDLSFRVVGTKPTFFSELVLDLDSEEKFQFSEGRSFEHFNETNGYFEAVIGATVARQSGLKVNSPIYPTHGVPGDSSAHVHEQGFVVVGVLEPTGTAHDRVVFVNMEGFFLMEDHAKPVADTEAAQSESAKNLVDNASLDINLDDGNWDDEDDLDVDKEPTDEDKIGSDESESKKTSTNSEAEQEAPLAEGKNIVRGVDVSKPPPIDLNKTPLPIEARELTAILVRTKREGDEFGMLDLLLSNLINGGEMETTLGWTPFRPKDSQKSAQAVNPIQQIEILFTTLVDPIRWLLLILTLMICVVSGISILVGIYNSMSQRKSEIAVMRALGANRTKVMAIILLESVLLAMAGGILGWLGGHGLNAVASPYFESQTGVPIGFFDFAPPVPLATLLGGNLGLPESIATLKMSPEFLIIPGLIVLAIFVGIYPAISAYRTDVSKSLGK